MVEHPAALPEIPFVFFAEFTRRIQIAILVSAYEIHINLPTAFQLFSFVTAADKVLFNFRRKQLFRRFFVF